MKLRLLAILAALLVSACADPAPRALVVDGSLRVLERGVPGVHPGANIEEWQITRGFDEGQLNLMELQGSVVVRANAPGGATMGRRIATTIGATPYLRWSWYLEPTQFGGGPGDGSERGMRLLVYFRSPARPTLERYGSWVGMPTAEWDRFVEISFGGFGAGRPEEARQSKWVSDDQGRKLTLRDPRTGQTGTWHVEAVDLAEVHRHFWPGENPATVQVTLISFGGLPGEVPETVPAPIGYVAEITLSR
ncbi:MAG: hypothetical protein HY059_03750 [Proteobacteria bacterium]|nr:hypothetical protein [Pseudomonadota bacterium]